MSMRVLFWVLGALFSCSAFADVPEIYKKLESLYEGSATPFPVEQYVSPGPNPKSHFAGCHFIGSDSSSADWFDFAFYRIKSIISPPAGPLDPDGDSNSFVFMTFEDEKGRGQSHGPSEEWQDGVAIVPVRSSAEPLDPKWCDGLNGVKETFNRTRSGLSADQLSYEIDFPCRSGKSQAHYSFRLAGDYLVARMDMRWWKAPSYFYCWQ